MNNELMAVFDYLERERGLDRETLCKVIEDALLAASKKSITHADDVSVHIDRKTCDIRAVGRYKVVDKVANPALEMALADARRIRKDAAPGDTIEVEVTPRNFGRIAAQTAKQAIQQRIRQAERERVFGEYRNREGDIVSGAVRRFDRSDVIVDLGRAEAVLPASERVPTEEYQIGDRIRAYILRVDEAAQGPMIILSRAHPEFVRRLFQLEVAEIADNTVEIKGIAREPGFRTKLAVFSHDEKVDPVGACVGLRGMRVKNIVRELSGEKIDIVRWNEDIRIYVANALAPAKLSKVNVDEATRTVSVIVDADQLSLAIGKKGQNARLTSKLTGWRIDIQRQPEDITFEEKVRLAVEKLAAIEAIGPARAEALVQAGFLSVEGVMAADTADLAAVEGFTPEIAEAVHRAAEAAYEKEHGAIEEA